jgi:hypothetical protein
MELSLSEPDQILQDTAAQFVRDEAGRATLAQLDERGQRFGLVLYTQASRTLDEYLSPSECHHMHIADHLAWSS